MTKHFSDSGQSGDAKTRKFETLLSGVALLCLLLMMAWLGNKIDVLDDGLRYVPPAKQQLNATGSAEIAIIEGQTLYVPAYSHIYSRGGEPHLLEVTLSIRNTDPTRSIRIATVQYFDTKGKPVNNYLEGQLELGPMETVEFLVEEQETQGGSGANFIVTWNADEPVYEPIVEAVMIGLSKGHSISFVSPARPLAQRSE
jgi:hypothetical protein